ncbi:MAG: hypothetical protein WDA27_07860 [Actinomycetota bacterium]
MSKTRKKPSAEQELYEHRRNAGEWSEEASAITVAKTTTEVVSFRLSTAELDELESSARVTGESLSAFIRKAIAIRIHGEPIGPAVQISFGAQSLYVQSHVVTGPRNINNADLFPSEAPGTVAAGF